MKRRWWTVVLALWAAVVVALGAQLMVAHAVALPPPTQTARLQAGLRELGPAAGRQLVHVIPGRCSCTRRLLAHLARRGPRPGWHERILVADGPVGLAAAAAAAGFEVRAVTGGWLAALGVEGAPLLVALVDGELAWVGGHFDAPAAVHPRDQAVVTALEAGGAPRPLPVFGCAVAPALARRLDPVGLLGWR